MMLALLFLAQVPVDGMQLLGFIGSAGALLWLYNEGKRAFGHTPPLHKEYATKSEITEAHGRIKRERAELDRAIEERRQENRDLSRKLEQELKEFRQLVDDLPERTIELLRKTKDLL